MKAADREAQLVGVIATQAATIAALTAQLAGAGVAVGAPVAPVAVPDPLLAPLSDPEVETAIARYSWGDRLIEAQNRATATRLARAGKSAAEIATRIARGGERVTTEDA